MALWMRSISTALPFVLAATAWSQQSKPAGKAPIVQPGAPGKRGKTISPSAAAGTAKRTPFEADVVFMQGMIHHHAQAVEMVDLLRTRGESTALRAFGERFTISQADEIQYMKDWLTER